MDIKRLSAELEARAGIGKVFQAILAVSLALNLLQVVGWITMDKSVRTHFVPPEITKPFTVGGPELDQDYLVQMGEYYISKFATVSPLSAEWQFNAILKVVDPAAAGVLQPKFKAITDKIRTENTSRVFFPSDIRVNMPDNAVALTGMMETWVANQRIGAPELKTFRISFYNRSGNALIKEIREADPQHPFAPANSDGGLS